MNPPSSSATTRRQVVIAGSRLSTRRYCSGLGRKYEIMAWLRRPCAVVVCIVESAAS